MEFADIYAYTQHLSVLYVEDEADVRESTASLLENYFRQVTRAANGLEGLEHYRKALEEGARYDIVISDINMPRLSGVEMSRDMLALFPQQAIVFITAHNESIFLMDAIKLGINNFLIKPLDLDELSTVLYQTAKMIYNQNQVEQQHELERQKFERNQRYQEALKQWSDVDYENADISIRKATELSAKTLQVGRVSIWLADETGEVFTCKDAYHLADGKHEEGLQLHARDYPEFVKQLHRGEIVVIEDTHNDPRTREFKDNYMKTYDIASVMDIPIMHEGRLLGVIAHEALSKPRKWHFDEQDFALMISGNVALSLEIKKRKIVQEELKEQKAILHHQAHHDRLTGLPNRTLFIDRLVQAIKQAQRSKNKLAVMFIDLDRFKEINDSLGHSVGDSVLQSIGERLKAQVRDSDTLARLGGDEFTLMLEGLSGNDGVVDIVQKLINSTQEPIQVEGHQLHVTLSIGITLFPDDGLSVEELLKNADAAMYKAKDEGRNTYQFYTYEMTRKAIERIKMEIDLRHALQHDQFVVYFQPKVNGQTDTLVGMEALVRWARGDEVVSPAVFMPLAEETGLVIDMDRWVMRKALGQLAQWYAEGLNPGVLSLNLTIQQLQTADFIDFLKTLLETTSCKAQWLELEVTEGQIMKHPEAAIETLKEIQALGIRLAIDDFGTGYSSLSYLKRLPIDTLKVDQSFVRELPDDEEDVAITKAIVALAKSLKLDVIAEGVETMAQKQFLVENGCQLIQGYLYSRPLQADAMHMKLQECAKKSNVVSEINFEI